MIGRRTYSVAPAVLAIVVVLLGGCSDGSLPVEPGEIDRNTAQTVTAIASDAAERLHAGILDAPTAQVLSAHLLELQQALETQDRRRAVQSVHAAAAFVAGYARSGATDDAADVTAIQLMLSRTAQHLGAPLNQTLIP